MYIFIWSINKMQNVKIRTWLIWKCIFSNNIINHIHTDIPELLSHFGILAWFAGSTSTAIVEIQTSTTRKLMSCSTVHSSACSLLQRFCEWANQCKGKFVQPPMPWQIWVNHVSRMNWKDLNIVRPAFC